MAIDGEVVVTTDGAAPTKERWPQPNDVVEIVFTSGTTGEPKGVMHTSNTLMASMVPYCERLRISPDVRVLMGSPLGHQTGFLYGMMMPLILGGRTVLMDVWDPGRAADLVKREGITFSMGSTPFLSDLTEVAEVHRSAFATLRVFLAAGSPIPRALVRRATENLGAYILSAWGMTECGAATVGKPDDPSERAYDTDGCPLRGIEVRVVDERDKPLPAGREGRLQVRGCNNFVGYLKRPELYQTDADGWFETGDLATMDEEQYIRITGRTKDIIIRGGENIPVVEIEGVLFQHPKVREVAIVGVPDPRLGERACAVVVPRAKESLRLDELTAFLAEKDVSKNYFPERLLLIDEMPKTPSGKIQKFALREYARVQGSRAQAGSGR
jgi:cyclohexanecarboxylate-CoA ligase